MELSRWISRLRDRYNQPAWPNREQARQALTPARDELQAWNLAISEGLLGNEFACDHRRRFAQIAEDTALGIRERPPEALRPPTMRGILSVVADPIGILMAEQQARQLARRLEPWSATCNDQVVWYFVDRSFDHIAHLGLAFDSARDTVNWTLDEYGIESPGFEPKKSESGQLPLLVRRILGAWEGWRIAVARDFEILFPRWPLDLSKWKKFGDLQNPFDPILELWLTGYLLFCSFEPEDPTIRLYARPLQNT